jgi:hypothetical protein
MVILFDLNSQYIFSPDLLCIAGFNLRSFLDEFRVPVDKFDSPLCVFLQVVKLILQGGKDSNALNLDEDENKGETEILLLPTSSSSWDHPRTLIISRQNEII